MVWSCAFNVWHPHRLPDILTCRIMHFHVFFCLSLSISFTLSPSLSFTLTLSSICKLKHHQIRLWRKVWSNNFFREFSFRGATSTAPDFSGYYSVQFKLWYPAFNACFVKMYSERVNMCATLYLCMCIFLWLLVVRVHVQGGWAMHMCACLLVQWLQHELQNYSSHFSEDTTGSPK